MVIKEEPHKVTAALKVIITGEFYGDEASEETLRYFVEQDLEDDGFDVDVEVLKDMVSIKAVAECLTKYAMPPIRSPYALYGDPVKAWESFLAKEVK